MTPDAYKRVSLITKTNFSEVWHAEDSAGQPVVLKIAIDNESTTRRLRNEIDALGEASGPSTMPVLDYDSVDFSWYTMPRAAYNLSDAPGLRDINVAIDVVAAIEAALHDLHAAGRPHRDLKPENILWLESDGLGRWVVADFGIIRNAPGTTTYSLTVEDAFLGSLGWAAPEQHANPHGARPAADVYAAAVIVAWILTGTIFDDSAPLLPTDSAIRGVLQRALKRLPERRFATMAEFLAALHSAKTALPSTLEDLIKRKAFGDLGAFIRGSAASHDDAIVALPNLDQDDLAAWYSQDRGGFIDGLISLCEDLAENATRVTFFDMDRFLSWCVDALRLLIHRARFDEAEELATAVFTAVANLTRYKPSTSIVRWIGRLDRRQEVPIENALHASGGIAFFRGQASNVYADRTDSELLKRLRRS